MSVESPVDHLEIFDRYCCSYDGCEFAVRAIEAMQGHIKHILAKPRHFVSWNKASVQIFFKPVYVRYFTVCAKRKTDILIEG